MTEPFDVMEVGRMAVITDPTGGALCLWEPRAHIGATLVNTPGSMAWNDLVTPDADAAAEFYGKLFGWTFEEIPDAGGYRIIRNGERSNGGCCRRKARPPGSRTSATMTPSALTGEIGDLGGRLYNGPMQVPNGVFAVLGDPQGAVFAVLTGEYDD